MSCVTWARSLHDEQIARVLNRLGYRTGHGKTPGPSPRHEPAQHTRHPDFRSGNGDGLVPAHDGPAAPVLGVSARTVHRLIVRKTLPATQPVPYAPWAIRRADLDLESVQWAVVAV